MFAEGADKLITAFIAHLDGNIQYIHRGITEKLFRIFQSNTG